VCHDRKNRGGVDAAYRGSKRVSEGVNTWLTVPFKGVRTGGGRDELVGDVASNAEDIKEYDAPESNKIVAGCELERTYMFCPHFTSR
jgi:hypothetical protein